jgi:hypothetical protein
MKFDFLLDAMVPLVRGGPVKVVTPIDARDLEKLRSVLLILDGVSPGMLESSRELVAAEITLSLPPLLLDDEALALAAALYDALWLSHPEAQGRSQSRLERVARFAEKCAQVAPAQTRDVMLSRHTMLHNLFHIGRTDRRVRFWAGSRMYLGKEPPARLLAWRSVRRVRVEATHRNWYRETDAPDAVRAIVRNLLMASPLTDVLNSARVEPPPSLSAIAQVARDAELARYACYQLVSSGLGPVAQPLGAQLADCAARRPDAPELRPAMAFACHLHILEALGGETVPAWMENESAWPQHDEARAFCGAFAAAWKARFLPSGLSADLEERLARRAEACARLAGQARLLSFSSALERRPPAASAC